MTKAKTSGTRLSRIGRVQKYIATYPNKTATQIAHALKIKVGQAHSSCWSLMDRGKIERIGPNGPRGGWTYKRVRE